MAMDLRELGESTGVLRTVADVACERERVRLHRVRRLGWILGILGTWLAVRLISGRPVTLGPPELSPAMVEMMPAGIMVLMLCCVVALPMLTMGKSPHVLYRPSEIDVSLDDVKGAKVVTEEIVK